GDSLTIDVSSFVSGSPALTIAVDSPAAGDNRVSVTGVPFAPVTFSGVPSVSVDAHGTTGNDTVTLSSDGLVASGMKNFSLRTRSGNDRFVDHAASFSLPVGGGTFSVEPNAGSDMLDFSGFGAGGLPLTVSLDRRQVFSHDGSSLTQVGDLAERFDVALAF